MRGQARARSGTFGRRARFLRRGLLVALDQLGHRHTRPEALDQGIGIVRDSDRIGVEGGGEHPRLALFRGGEVVDLQLHPVAVGVAVEYMDVVGPWLTQKKGRIPLPRSLT